MKRRILSIWLSLCMVLTMLPISAMAAETDASIGTSGEIIAFAPLDETELSVSTGTAIEDLGLPEKLLATVRTADSGVSGEPVQDSGNPDEGSVSGSLTVAATASAIEAETNEPKKQENGEEKTVEIPVTWTAGPEYDGNENGVYVFTPVIEGYTVSADLPEISVTVGTQPRMMALRTGTPATYGDFSVSIDQDGAVPIYNGGILTFGTAGEYTVSMADNKTSTTNRIVVNTTGEVKLNLNGVVIEAPPSVSYRVPDGATALTATSGTVTLNVIADSSLTGGMGYSSLTDVGKGGAGISGNITVMGIAALTATGGAGGSINGGTSGDGGAGISGNVTVTEDATLTATGGEGGSAAEGNGGSGGAGISGNVTATGAATLTATGGAAGTGYTNNDIAGMGIRGNVVVSGTATLIAVSGSGAAGRAISNARDTITVDEGYIVKVGDNAADAARAQPTPHNRLTGLSSLYIIVTLPTAPNLPTAAEYAAASPAAAPGTDYVLDTTDKILTVKTAKGAAWWSANGDSYNDYTVLLANNIDVSAFLWSPVGRAPGSAFGGTFDGRGRTITGLTVKIEAGDESIYAGLFGEFGGSVKNVGLVNVSIVVSNTSTGNSQVFAGPLAGGAYAGTIANCFVRGGSVSATSDSGACVGGLIGNGSGSIAIGNCYSNADVSAAGMNGCNGGVIGLLTSGAVDQCYYVNNPVGPGTNLIFGTQLTDAQMKAASGTDTLIYHLNTWVKSSDYYTWQADSENTNGGYPVFGAAWAEPQAQWGVAGMENAAPNTWVGSGSLTNAVAYANGLASGAAYIRILDSVHTTAPLEFAENKTTVLDLNGKTIDGDSIPAGSGANRSVLTVNGNLTLCDSGADTVANQGKITGGHGAGDGIGGGVYVHDSGTLIMTGGNITGNTAVNGGGVGSYGTFTMIGGSIAGNSCILFNNSAPCGGGVVNFGYFNMRGGSITGNTVAGGGSGGGVFTDAMTLSGDVNISGNTVGTASNNVALMSVGSGGAAIHITGALTNSTAIGVSIVELSKGNVFTPKAGVFTFGDVVTNSNYISKFVSDNIGFAVIANGSQLKLAAAQAITKADATNGSFTVKVNGNGAPSAIEGQTVTVTPAADANYELDTITVTKAGDPSTTVTVTSGTFTMPAYAVTVNVTFKVSSVPTYTISGSIKGSDSSAGIPAALQLKNSGGNVGGIVTAAADGSYSITGVPAGSYTIAVSCTGYDSGTITGITVANAAITGKDLTLTKSISGLTDAQKIAAAQAAIMAAINRMSFSNSTTAADILNVVQAASLYGVTVAWDTANEFTKTQATTSAKGSIRGTLNQASNGIGIDATIARLSTGGNSGGSGGTSGTSGGSGNGSNTPTPSTKPIEPVTGSTESKATVDNKFNASASLTDKDITDIIAAAKAEAVKKGVNAGDITAVIHVTTGGRDANTVTVNLPKTTQEQIIGNNIASVQLVIDRPDLTIGIDLAAVTEINRQAKGDVQLSATRMDHAKLFGAARAAIGNRPAYDLKALYGSGNSVTDFGKGSVSVEIPYTLQKGELAGNVYVVYADEKGKVTYLTDSSYDAKRGTAVFSSGHLSAYGIAYKASFNFTDIGGHWAKDDILFAANRGLMTATGTGTFSPNGSMTRGMFVTALGRLANADISAYRKSSFSDVKAGAYYMGYIEWASKNNIVNGVGNGKFAPDQSITREQMAVIVSNYAKTIGYTLPKVHIENIFADNAKISTYAKEAVKQMQIAGVISGKNGNLYDPQGTATRAEASAVLRRFVELAIFSDTAQGWKMNDSGKWMYYENGKPVTGKKDLNGSTYTFDQYGVAADMAKNLRYNTYIVKKGDCFWLIARKLGCTISELERLNNKSRFAIIYRGDVLLVPEK